MANNRYREKGYYIPFKTPISLPDPLDPDGSEVVALCAPSSWLPQILGALKVLAQPETWAGSDDIECSDAARYGHRLLSMFSEPCNPCAKPPGEWYCDYDFKASDCGFSIRQVYGQDAGEWVSGVGFRATIVDTGISGPTRYQKMLQIYKEWDTLRNLLEMDIVENGDWTLAPGGIDGRFQACEVLDVGFEPICSYTSWPTETLLNTLIVVQTDGLAQGTLITCSFACGQDSSSSTLEIPYVELWGLTFYGAGDQGNC